MPKFDASSNGHSQGANAIDQFSGDANGYWTVFGNSVSSFDGWWGNRHDSYSQQLYTNWEKSINNVMDAGNTIFQAISSVAQSTKNNATMLDDAQNDSVNTITNSSGHH